MIKIVDEINLSDFDAWGQAVDVKNRILDEGKEDEFENYVNELYPDGISQTSLNDLLVYESSDIYKYLGIYEFDTVIIVDELMKQYKDRLTEAYKEDKTVDFVIDDIISESVYHDDISDDQRDEIVSEIDFQLS